MKRVVVIGGGASGLMAAYRAAENGSRVTLIERNEKLGKKLYITGKGRCNLTNDCLPEVFLQNVVRGEKFLSGIIRRFSPQDMMELLRNRGLALKTERGQRVFPASDHASDVTRTLEAAAREAGAEIRLNERVVKFLRSEEGISGVATDRAEYACDAAVLATGGLSYPSTGSTGDGLALAREAGHTVTECVPSLTGVRLKEDVSAIQGISLKNVVLCALRGNKTISSRMGELLFTHYGISGPLVLSLSAEINRIPMKELSLFLDFKPALDEEMLKNRLLRDLSARKNERMSSVMRGLLPGGLGGYVLERSGISAFSQANAVTREERARLVSLLKKFPLTPIGLRGFEEAIVTSGGVNLNEVNPRTLESKLVKGLYFCGEVLDLDAYTGGFNLQIAFSTGYVAGESAGASEKPEGRRNRFHE